MERLTSELYGLFKESNELEVEIKSKLSALGFGKRMGYFYDSTRSTEIFWFPNTPE